MKRDWIDGPLSFISARDRWILIRKARYDDYYVNPDSEVYSDVLRAQWVLAGGIIATLDYYVRKGDVYGGTEPAQADLGQWEVVEKVHFYDPDETCQQIEARTFQHDALPATEENLAKAEARCRVLLDGRDNSHLHDWWEEWRKDR